MPTKEAHLQLAQHNQMVITHLLPEIDKFSDWISTIAFYKALHIVEAIFAKDGFHGANHENRDKYLKRNNRYTNIYRHYHQLWCISMMARYLRDSDTKSDLAIFSDYISSEQVKNRVLNHHLR